MEFSIKTGSPENLTTPCLVVGVFEEGKLTAPAQAIDQASAGAIQALIAAGDVNGKAGSTVLLRTLPGVTAERLLLVGLGKEASDKSLRDAVGAALRALSQTGAKEAVFALAEALPAGRDQAWGLRQAVIRAEETAFRSDGLKSKKDEAKGVSHLAFLVPDEVDAQAALLQGKAIAEGMNLAKELGNLPGNICTPKYLAEQAKELAKEFKLKADILDRDDMAKLGMGALLAVAQGSKEAPRFIVLEYKGAKKKDKPIVLVGKGVTFDTGGISLKPGAEMDEMKYDMCGAASVLAAIRIAAQLELPLNLITIVPAAENMPGGQAIKPGDIVTSLSGQTIEILNTDAEGRLLLCDALTYAERFEPECVVDVATLTGACVIALGAVASGLLANDDALAAELLAAGQRAGDKAWQMPLWDEYQEMLQSNFADIPNIGSKGAGTITAAAFLSRFTKAYKWAHLDIAGTAWKSGKEKGSTARPVPLLAEFLMAKVEKA